MANTLNLSGLTKYVNELSGVFLKESVLAGNTFKYISVQKGVKHTDALNLMTSTLVGSTGLCNSVSSATGSVALTQRTLNVCPISITENPLCLNEFEQYWIGQLAKEGSYNESAPQEFNEMYISDKVAKVGAMVEDIFWKGSLTSAYGGGNLALCNGVLHILESTSATNSVISTTFSGALTPANAITVVDDMVSLIPSDVLDAEDLTLFMSYANFRILMNALRNNNYFPKYDGTDAHTWVLENYTNTNVRIVATRGLNGRNEMVLTPASNLFLGTDSFGELTNGDNFQFWYSMDEDAVFFRAKFKIGAQVAYPQYVVIKNS
jgi:hypothetical protein